MAVQPTGTVTLLFSDIEGSTRLLERLGPVRYRDSLELHRRLLRKAFVHHGGYEVDHEGDAFFVAFSSVGDAVAAASEAQKALAGAEWPDGVPIRVRMGIHTGEPLAVPPKYVGLDVHKAARVMASGHGGQVVLTQSARDLAGDLCAFVDLGEHRLKDLSRPQRLYQLGAGEFPPLRTLYRSNLPVPATSFLGREREVSAVVSLISDARHRLVTILGPGGVGKTRLSLQAASEAGEAFPDGVTWVPLASVADAEGAIAALAQALEVGEQPGRSLAQVVAETLATSRRLVLLDNAEHLLPALATSVSALVRAAPSVTIAVTSRERLRVDSEVVYELAPLNRADAVKLFKTRAAAVTSVTGRDDETDELCRRLDCLPLAIELAAARAALFTPGQLVARLAERLDLLRGARDAEARHATLRATIEWSFDLLDNDERLLVVSLSIFPGGCTYEMAEAVCDANPVLLEALIDKSLLRRRETTAEPRYWMLETVREFARSHLDRSSAFEALQQKFVNAQREFATAFEPSWLTNETTLWFRRFQLELDNLREAMSICASNEDHETALAIAGDLTGGWQRAGLIREGTERVRDALRRAPDASAEIRGMGLFCLGVLAGEAGDGPAALTHIQSALPLIERYRPEIGVFARYMIFERTLEVDRVGAVETLAEAVRVAEATGNPTLYMITAISQAELLARDDPQAALEIMSRAVTMARGWDVSRLIEALYHFAGVAASAGKRDQARAALSESLALATETLEDEDHTGTAQLAMASLGLLAVLDADPAEGSEWSARVHDSAARTGSDSPETAAHVALLDAAIAMLCQRPDEADAFAATADAIRAASGAPWPLIAADVASALKAARSQPSA